MCSNRVNPVKHRAARTKSDRQAFVTRESDSNLIFELATKPKIPSAVSLSACFVGTVTARRRETTFQASSIPFGWQHFGRSQCQGGTPLPFVEMMFFFVLKCSLYSCHIFHFS